MSYYDSNPYATFGRESTVAHAAESERAAFIRRTYTHLAGAVALFVGIEALVFLAAPPEAVANLVRLMGRPLPWLIFMGMFVGVSWIAQHWAMRATSLGTQYLGLGLYVVAESIIFIPILFVATRYPNVVPAAALMTGVIFGGLTLAVFSTRVELTWLGRYLWLAGLGSLGVVICSVIFGFNLGLLFSAVMIVLAAGYILYDTSNILHRYHTAQHVAAALALFASVALLFWYVLRIAMELNSRRD